MENSFAVASYAKMLGDMIMEGLYTETLTLPVCHRGLNVDDGHSDTRHAFIFF